MTNTESHKLADGQVIIEFKSINQTKVFIEQSWRAIRRAVEHANDTEKAMDAEIAFRRKNHKGDKWPDKSGWAKSACLENIIEGATFNSRADNLWGLRGEYMATYAMGAFFRDRIFAVMQEYPEINLDNIKEARKILCGLRKL